MLKSIIVLHTKSSKDRTYKQSEVISKLNKSKVISNTKFICELLNYEFVFCYCCVVLFLANLAKND